MIGVRLAHRRAITAEMRWEVARDAAQLLLATGGPRAVLDSAARDLQAAADEVAAARLEFQQAMTHS